MSKNSIYNRYKTKQIYKFLTILGGLFALILLLLVCTNLGIIESSISLILKTIVKGIKGEELRTTQEQIIYNLRIPRTLLAVLAGASLAVSGNIMQAITKNSLVSPFTIGVSSAASFGAAIAIAFGFYFVSSGNIGIIINAFTFSILCAIIIFIMSSKLKLKSEVIILTGIALNYFFQALTASIKFISEDTKLAKIVAWTFGSLNGAEWTHVLIISAFFIPGFIFLFSINKSFTVLSTMDDDIAKTMGINPLLVRTVATTLSVILTASVISFTGIIGFVGLASPHISRAIIGNNYKYTLPMSAIVGSILVLVSDTIGRLIFSPVVIPVGIVISFVGVPIFIHQVLLSRLK